MAIYIPMYVQYFTFVVVKQQKHDICMAVIDFRHNPFFFQYSGAVNAHHLS